jgi:glycosyltransferase involved in cell wall biosynthesis
MTGISVVVPTFDRPELLRETLRRLAGQSVPPREVLVVDNGTAPAALAAETTVPFPLRYFRICARAGAAQARNFGAALALGGYVAFLDDDDFWEPDYLEVLSGIVENAGARAPAMIVARVDHLENGDRHFFRFAGDDPRMEACFYFNPGYLGSAMTVERASFLELGGFDPAFATGEDKELAVRYMAHGRVIAYDARLVAINRVHEHSLSHRIDHVGTARQLVRKYRAHVDARVRLRTLREAYKKSGETRYWLHKAVLKIILAVR